MRSSLALAASLALTTSALVGGALACGAFGSDDPESQPAPAPTSTTPDAGGTADSTAPDTGTPDAGCATTERVLTAIADTGWNDDACAMSITYGDSPFLNLAWTALAFTDPAGGVDLGSAVALRLELTADPSCKDCGTGLPTQAGQVLAFPLRTDWVEKGDGGTYNGADECRRTAGNPGFAWGTDPTKTAKGAPSGTKIAAGIDYDDRAGTGELAAGQTAIAIALDPKKFAARFPAGSTTVAVLLHRTALVVLASRENGKGIPAPRLVVTECKR